MTDKLLRLSGNGLIGYEATDAFLSWLATSSKAPSLDAVLDKPNSIDWDSDWNVSVVLIRNAMEVARKDPKSLPKVARLFLFLSASNRKNLVSEYIDEIVGLLGNADYRNEAASIIKAFSSTAKALNTRRRS